MAVIMDVEFTHCAQRYATDCETFRAIFEALGTEEAQLIITAGLRQGTIILLEEGPGWGKSKVNYWPGRARTQNF